MNKGVKAKGFYVPLNKKQIESICIHPSKIHNTLIIQNATYLTHLQSIFSIFFPGIVLHSVPGLHSLLDAVGCICGDIYTKQ